MQQIFGTLYKSVGSLTSPQYDAGGLCMKRQIKITLIVIISALIAAAVIMLWMHFSGRDDLLTPVGTRGEFIGDTDKYPSILKADGSTIRDASGRQVILKGVTVPESAELSGDGRFDEEFYDDVFSLGGNTVRVPISPEEYKRDDYYLWRYLDKVVTWAGENDNYVILELDYTGNPIDGSGDEMPDMDENPLDYAAEIWKNVADYFKNTPNVIFEIYNEPEGMSDTEWKRCADSLVGVIRDTGADQLVIVGSPDYCYSLGWIEEIGMDDENVAFSLHVYPDRTMWSRAVQRYVSGYPIIVTEWGYEDDDSDESGKYHATEDSFGKPFSEFLENNSISWMAANYSYEEAPAMFNKNYKSMTKWGEFVSGLLDESGK